MARSHAGGGIAMARSNAGGVFAMARSHVGGVTPIARSHALGVTGIAIRNSARSLAEGVIAMARSHVGGVTPIARSHAGGVTRISIRTTARSGGVTGIAIRTTARSHTGGVIAMTRYHARVIAMAHSHVGGVTASITAIVMNGTCTRSNRTAQNEPTHRLDHCILIELLSSFRFESLPCLAEQDLGLGAYAQVQGLANEARIDRILGQVAFDVPRHGPLHLAHVQIARCGDPFLLRLRRHDSRQLARLRHVDLSGLDRFGQLWQLRQRIGQAKALFGRVVRRVAKLVDHVVDEARMTELLPELNLLRFPQRLGFMKVELSSCLRDALPSAVQSHAQLVDTHRHRHVVRSTDLDRLVQHHRPVARTFSALSNAFSSTIRPPPHSKLVLVENVRLTHAGETLASIGEQHAVRRRRALETTSSAFISGRDHPVSIYGSRLARLRFLSDIRTT